MGDRARQRVAELRWEDTARLTLALLDRERRRAQPDALPARGLLEAGVAPAPTEGSEPVPA
jgi:hypothetical protein